MIIETIEQLRALYPAPGERAVRKQISSLDRHCRRFIELSPFVVVASGGSELPLDASPRGGEPGFVRVPDERTLLIPDAPGNNRLDTLENILATGKAGLLFLIPGVDETLRVNGDAMLSCADEHIQAFAGGKRLPRLVIQIRVREAYLHCAKAFMRSNLWHDSARVDRSVLPTLGEMLQDQTCMTSPVETQEQMLARYAPDL